MNSPHRLGHRDLGGTARRLARTWLLKLGFEIRRLPNVNGVVRPDWDSLQQIRRRVEGIPGMIPIERAEKLYWLAYGSPIRGDVIEIGVWQGRTTCFLAQACQDADNGMVHAVDTFSGNPGREHLYVVSRPDLTDLETNFRRNIEGIGLSDRVITYPMPSLIAANKIGASGAKARMIVVDGDHNYQAVREDLHTYQDLLDPGGLLVLDDYHRDFPGVIRAADEFLAENADLFLTPVQDGSSLIIRRR